jgi:hypothetical protein
MCGGYKVHGAWKNFIGDFLSEKPVERKYNRVSEFGG